MSYSMYLMLAMATVPCCDSCEEASPQDTLDDAIGPNIDRLRLLLLDFSKKPITPQSTYELEQRLRTAAQDVARAGLEWTLNQCEPSQIDALPSHVQFEAGYYTRMNRKTPRNIATTFGKIRLRRVGYRSTHKTGDPAIFPLMQQLGIVAGATPALAERAAFYQAEAGATQRRTLQRLKQEHQVDWGVKKLREVVDLVALSMAVERHEVQVKKLLHWLEQAWSGTGKHKPVLSLGRDGITFGLPVRGGTIREVATAGTVSVLDRHGRRLGTVYLAYTPESKQGTMGAQMTQLVKEVLRRWEHPLPRLCYVTDAGDNETTYYNKVLKRMCHPRTGERLEWTRVLDYYHASERLWTMAEALFGNGSTAKAWVRRMQKLLKKPNGIRRVLSSAAALRSRCQPKGKSQHEFTKAYNYLRLRTKYMRYAAYKRVGIPLGSGVTEAACKTIYTQRLKLSGMRWKKAGAQTILTLRVLLLSDVWQEAYQRALSKIENVKVPTHATKKGKTAKKAA
jgi:hypothetical protein